MTKLLALLAVPVAGAAVVGWLMQPPAEPKTGHVMGETAGIEPGDPIVEVALPDALSPEAAMGKTFFEAKCMACHGENAAGTNGTAPPLIHAFYRSGHHSDEAFQRAAKLGVQQHHWRFGNMPPVEGLTVADVKYITRYVRELHGERDQVNRLAWTGGDGSGGASRSSAPGRHDPSTWRAGLVSGHLRGSPAPEPKHRAHHHPARVPRPSDVSSHRTDFGGLNDGGILVHRSQYGAKIRQQSGTSKNAADKLVGGIMRKTRKQYSAQEKIGMVPTGLRREESVAAPWRREGIAERPY